jgi:hypothetical protein
VSGVASLDDVAGSSSDMQCCLFTCIFVSMGFCVSLLHGLSARDRGNQRRGDDIRARWTLCARDTCGRVSQQ